MEEHGPWRRPPLIFALAFSTCLSTSQEAPHIRPLICTWPQGTALTIKPLQAGPSSRSMHCRVGCHSASLQGHLREIPPSVFLASFHAQRQKLKVNQQKAPKLLMPLKAQPRAEDGSCVQLQRRAGTKQPTALPPVRARAAQPKPLANTIFHCGRS